jgi:hypothetical protein
VGTDDHEEFQFDFNASDFHEDGDVVTLNTAITATHNEPLALIPGVPVVPATGKRIQIPEERHTYTIRDGKLARLAVVGLRRLIDAPLPPSEKLDFTAFVDRIRSHMDQDMFDIAWRRGEAYAHEPEALCSLLLQSS